MNEKMNNVVSEFLQDTLNLVGVATLNVLQSSEKSESEIQEWKDRCRQFRPHLEWIASSDSGLISSEHRESAKDTLIVFDSLLSGKSSDG